MRILRQRRGGLDTTYPTRLFQPLIQRARRHIQIPRRLGWVPSLHTNQIHRLLPELTRVMLVASDLHTGSLAPGNSTAAGLSGAHALFGEYQSMPPSSESRNKIQQSAQLLEFGRH